MSTQPKVSRSRAFILRNKTQIHHCMRSHIALDAQMVETHMDAYYLLFWTPQYFRAQLKDGLIEHQNITYRVVYYDLPYTLKSKDQIRLSFRAAREEYNLFPIVMISMI